MLSEAVFARMKRVFNLKFEASGSRWIFIIRKTIVLGQQDDQRFYKAFLFIYLYRNQIKGKVEGNLDVLGGANLGLKAALDKLSNECNDVTDISIKYYATDLPERLPTTISGLLSLIENFPSRLKSINDGRGIPVQVRFPSS